MRPQQHKSVHKCLEHSRRSALLLHCDVVSTPVDAEKPGHPIKGTPAEPYK